MTLACILYSCLHDYVDKSMELNRQQTIVLLMEIEELKVVMEKKKERSKVMDEKDKSWRVFW